jgi:hypothetical protein
MTIKSITLRGALARLAAAAAVCGRGQGGPL